MSEREGPPEPGSAEGRQPTEAWPETGEPAATGEPTPTGEPTATGEPAATGEPTPTVEPAAAGEPSPPAAWTPSTPAAAAAAEAPPPPAWTSPTPPSAAAPEPSPPGTWVPQGAATPPDATTPPTAATPPPPSWAPTPAAPAAPLPGAPLVGWGPPPTPSPLAEQYEGGPPPFRTGALLRDTFARYGADPLRIFLLSAVAAILSYGSSFGAGDPFSPQPNGLAGILGLLSFVVGILTGSITIALLDGGPRMATGRIIRRGVERAGWMVLTSIVIGLAAFVIILVLAIPAIIVAIASPNAGIVLFLLLFLVFVWLILRITFAIVANVADNLNTVDAIKLSWRITRPSGVWLRIIACSFLLGLLILPASIGAVVVSIVGVFSDPLLLVAAGLLLALLSPLSSILLYSAYRRLVPPIRPHWATSPVGPAAAPAPQAAWPPTPAVAQAPAPTWPATEAGAPAAPSASAPPGPPADPAGAPTEPAIPPLAPLVTDAQAPAPPAAAAPAVAWATTTPATSAAPPVAWAAPDSSSAPVPAGPRPVFRTPRFDAGAKFVLAVMIALGALGIASVTWLAMEFAAGRIDVPTFPTSPTSPGFPGFPSTGDVSPGTVAFGTSAETDTCGLGGQTLVATSDMEIYWVAAFSRRTRPSDEIRLRITYNGTEILNELEAPGAFDCFGNEEPETDLEPGVYVYEMLLNGAVDASGTLFVN